MTTTLRCLDFGVYQVRQVGQRYTRPVTLERATRGTADWQLLDGDHGCWRFGTFADAKAWLFGPDGQAWLDQLPRAEVTA